MKFPKIQYNAPVVLTFSILCCLVYMLSATFTRGLTDNFFALRASFSFTNPLDYFRILSYTIGHANSGHLLGNLTFILLLGPILEEKYGSKKVLTMMIVTAIVTGILHVLTSSLAGLLGASGIVFLFIILASIVDTKAGHVPLTFILVALIYLGKEFADIFRNDNVSQLAHICGGGIAAFFGFFLSGKKG